jgi:hypothetical protein
MTTTMMMMGNVIRILIEAEIHVREQRLNFLIISIGAYIDLNDCLARFCD